MNNRIKRVTGHISTIEEKIMRPATNVKYFTAYVPRKEEYPRSRDHASKNYLTDDSIMALAKLRGEGYRYFVFISEQGDTTCERCKANHGKFLDMSKGVESEVIPPLHPNCRCKLAAIDNLPYILYNGNSEFVQALERYFEELKGGLYRIAPVGFSNGSFVVQAEPVKLREEEASPANNRERADEDDEITLMKKLFLHVMTDEQLRYMSENNNRILELLSEQQRQRLIDGEYIFVILSELDPVKQAEINVLSQNVMNTLNHEQKTDLLFLGSGMLTGIDFTKRLAILGHIKENDGKITYDDLVRIGVYKQGDLAEGGYRRWLQNMDVGGPANFPSLVETEYRLNNFETSFAQLDQAERQRRGAQLSVMFAMAAAPIIDRALYGPSRITYDNNIYDNLERQGTSGNFRGSDVSWKPENTESVARPSWRQSEIDVGKEHPDYDSQRSFKDGKEVPYGTPGSSRPDYYKPKSTIEVKNYDITTSSGRSNLKRNITRQVIERRNNLPTGTTQTVIIDARGQNVTNDSLMSVKDELSGLTGNDVIIKFMR